MNKNSSPKSPRILKVRKDGAYDCVYVNRKKIRLGRTGTSEADDNFRRIQIQVLTNPTYLYCLTYSRRLYRLFGSMFFI